MGLQHSYALIAPFYDALLAGATSRVRARSLARLPAAPAEVLINGVGTGLDLPHLPPQHRYTGLDLTPAMLRRSAPRVGKLDFRQVQGDAQRLPFRAASFDHAVLHLILAVVPNPAACLAETARVVRPGGSILIFDKFLRPGQHAPLRRLANPLLRRIATRLDVVFETVFDEAGRQIGPLHIESDEPAMAGGWFRLIRLRRAA